MPSVLMAAGRTKPFSKRDMLQGSEVPTAGFRSSLFLPVYLPLLLLALLTIVFRVSHADVEICRLFYGRGFPGWWGTHSALLRFVYEQGATPALTLGSGGLAVGILSLFWRRLVPYRQAGFFLAAMLALGPGLIVNCVFKPHWHRPRPTQTLTFGGGERFVPVWQLGSSPQNKSFPSGHASMGFYLLAPAFLCSRRQRLRALAFVALGLASGLLMGAGRVMQGAHYPSDVVWSAGMVYLSGLFLVGMFQFIKSAAHRDQEFVVPFPESVVSRQRFPACESTEAREPEEVVPARRAA